MRTKFKYEKLITKCFFVFFNKNSTLKNYLFQKFCILIQKKARDISHWVAVIEYENITQTCHTINIVLSHSLQHGLKIIMRAKQSKTKFFFLFFSKKKRKIKNYIFFQQSIKTFFASSFRACLKLRKQFVELN
jgi:hypothetical protein